MASREFDTGLVGSRRASALAMQTGLLVNICTQLGSLGCSLTGSSCSDITSPCALLVPSRASQTAFIHPFTQARLKPAQHMLLPGRLVQRSVRYCAPLAAA